MAELRKRLNSGWILMDAIVNQSDGSIKYFLERSKHHCVIVVDNNGYGHIIK